MIGTSPDQETSFVGEEQTFRPFYKMLSGWTNEWEVVVLVFEELLRSIANMCVLFPWY